MSFIGLTDRDDLDINLETVDVGPNKAFVHDVLDRAGRVLGGVTLSQYTPQTATPGAATAALPVRNIPSGTQAVSLTSVPLPTGAATETTLAAIDTKLGARLPSALGTGGGVKVDIVSGGGSGGGTEYTEGATDTTITGTAFLWEDAGDTLRPISAGTPLPVNVVAGGAGGGAVDGTTAHDAAAAAVEPVLVGGYASAAAPANVSATTDAVRAWFLLNGAQATVLTASGALIGGDATNGLDVDVTRVSGTVTVGDGGGTLTVDAPVATPVNVQIGDGTRTAVVRTTGAIAALNVAIVDGSGQQITAFGGSGGAGSNFGSAVPTAGTAAGYSDGTNMQIARVFDVDSGAGSQLVQGVSLRKTASGGSVEFGTASDPLRTDPTGTTTQPVSGTVTANAGTGNFTVVNGGTFAVQPAGSVAHDGAAAAVNPMLMGGFASATAPANVSAANDSVRAWFLLNGAQAMVLTAAGALIGGDATNGLDVDVTRVTGTVTVAGTVTANLGTLNGVALDTTLTGGTQKAINRGGAKGATAAMDVTGTSVDADHNALDVFIRGGSSSGTEYTEGATDTTITGQAILWEDSSDTLRPVSDAKPLPVQQAQLTAANDTVTTVGAAAHDAAVSGNPVRGGARAVNAEITAVANGDTVDLVADLTGRQIVAPHTNPENIVTGTSGANITDTTDHAIIAAQGAGVRIYLTDFTITNAHATVGTWVVLKSGSTVIHEVFCGPNGGGESKRLSVPYRLAANAALNAACLSSGLAVRVSANGYKGA